MKDIAFSFSGSGTDATDAQLDALGVGRVDFVSGEAMRNGTLDQIPVSRYPAMADTLRVGGAYAHHHSGGFDTSITWSGQNRGALVDMENWTAREKAYGARWLRSTLHRAGLCRPTGPLLVYLTPDVDPRLWVSGGAGLTPFDVNDRVLRYADALCPEMYLHSFWYNGGNTTQTICQGWTNWGAAAAALLSSAGMRHGITPVFQLQKDTYSAQDIAYLADVASQPWVTMAVNWGEHGSQFDAWVSAVRSNPRSFAGIVAGGFASEIAGVADGGTVSTWAGGAASGAPKLHLNVVNGNPVVRFNGSTDYFTFANVMSGKTQGRVFVVLKINADPPASDGQTGLWKWGTDSQSDHYPWRSDGVVYCGWGSANRKTAGNPTPSLASWRILEITSKSGEFTVRIDGATLYTTASNTVGFAAAPLLGKSAGNYYLAGDIESWWVYDSLSESDATLIRNALATRNGLTI